MHLLDTSSYTCKLKNNMIFNLSEQSIALVYFMKKTIQIKEDSNN